MLDGKGWTNAGVAQAAITLAKVVLLDERSIYPASTTLRGPYGYDGDMALSMPCMMGREGVLNELPVNLNDRETKNWRNQPHSSRRPRRMPIPDQPSADAELAAQLVLD